jgi:hypothetical protein
MFSILGDLLPLAVGIAISPLPIIAVVLILLGRHARTTGPAFVLGWIFGVSIATAVFTVVGDAVTTTEEPGSAIAWIKLALGVLLLVAGARDWRARSADQSDPAWMATIDSMRAPVGLGAGAVLSAVNPKNLMLAAAAGVTIGSADLTTEQASATIAVFVVIASVGVAGPVAAYLLAADRLAPRLTLLQSWLRLHNQAVMAVLFTVLGVSLVGKGVGGLL